MSYILKISTSSIKYISNNTYFPFVFQFTCDDQTHKSEEISSKQDKISKSFFFKTQKPINKIDIIVSKTTMYFFSSEVRI